MNDHATTKLACTSNELLGDDPALGAGYWYLVRGDLGTTKMTYDSLGEGQDHERDLEIAQSAAGCP